MPQIETLLKQHPEWPAVKSIYHNLRSHGYRAFLAGGCVRDALLGRPAKDLDVATDASPEQIEAIFPKTVSVGKSFGVMRVLEEGQDVEVATFRTDGPYQDGRRPERVIFSTPEEDARRRDFTVNALFYDLESQKILDFVEGQKDLSKKIIRTVGDPARRFAEDHLRLLRAVRFVAQLDFTIESKTLESLRQHAATVASVSGERLRDEWCKILQGPFAAKALRVAEMTGLRRVVFPFAGVEELWVVAEKATPCWQLFVLYLKDVEKSSLEKVLDRFKFSAKERRAIGDSWQIWQNADALFSLRLGEQLQQMSRPGVSYGLQILAQKKHFDRVPLQRLEEAWSRWGKTLPTPFLSGDDVREMLQGPEIGECLQEAFCLQLEKKITHREEALQWLSLYFEKRA